MSADAASADPIGATTSPNDPPQPETLSLVDAVRRFARIASAMAGTRFALFQADIGAARDRLLRGILFAAVGAILGFVSLIFGAAAVLVYFWDSYRLEAAIAIPVVLAVIAALVSYGAMASLRGAPKAFAATMETLRADRKAIVGEHDER